MPSDTVLDSRLFIRHDLGNAHKLNLSFQHSDAARGHFANQLLLYDSIVIPTSDFGIIPMLIDWLGLDLFREAVRDRSIQFIRPKGLLTYSGNGNALGTFVIRPTPKRQFLWWQEALFGSSPASMDLQLKSQCSSISRRDRETLVGDLMLLSTDLEFTNEVFMKHIAEESYRDILASPLLTEFVSAHLTENTDLRKLPGVEGNQTKIRPSHSDKISNPIDLVLRCAEFNLELLMATKVGDADIETADIAPELLRTKLVRSKIAEDTGTEFCNLLAIAKVPNIQFAVERGEVSPSEVWRLRNQKEAIDFRKWLRDAQSGDEGSLSDAYLEAIKKVPLVDKLPLRVLRFGITTAAGKLDPTLGLAVGTVDSFFVSRWLKGYNPKVFMDQVTDLVHDNQ